MGVGWLAGWSRQDLAPSRTVERFLGIGSLDHNVAIARRG